MGSWRMPGPTKGVSADVPIVTGKAGLRVELKDTARSRCRGEGPDQRERRRGIARHDDPGFAAAEANAAAARPRRRSACLTAPSVANARRPKQGRWSLSTPPVIRDDQGDGQSAMRRSEGMQPIRWFEDIRLGDTVRWGARVPTWAS